MRNEGKVSEILAFYDISNDNHEVWNQSYEKEEIEKQHNSADLRNTGMDGIKSYNRQGYMNRILLFEKVIKVNKIDWRKNMCTGWVVWIYVRTSIVEYSDEFGETWWTSSFISMQNEVYNK